MKVLLVGEAPSSPGRRPFEPRPGGSGDRLARLLDVDDLSTVFDPVNLSAYPYCPEEAVATATTLLLLAPHDRFVLAGRNVADAFGIAVGRPLGEVLVPLPVLDRTLLLVPHPSGRNRYWNDPAARDRAGRALRDFCRNS